MSDTLFDSIKKNADKISFHTPSHAGMLPEDFYACDVTELNYTDNLLSPSSYIGELEKNIASAYGAEACFISTQGATCNIFMAAYAVKNLGAFLIIGKAHFSVYNALRAFGCRAYHADAFPSDKDIPRDVRVVIVTSPDYFGRTEKLAEISRSAKRNGLTLIIDSAHGSHFVFNEKLPQSATVYGDLVILSLHKTLPVMTGGSVLCAKKEYEHALSAARKILHTTSPSFPVICSIERAFKELKEHGKEDYDKVLEAVEEFKRTVAEPFNVEENDDKTRLVLTSPYDGKEVEKALFEAGFVAELSVANKVVFIVNPYNRMHLGGLAEAVNGLSGLAIYEPIEFPSRPHPKPTSIDLSGEPEAVPISEAKGRRAFCEVGFYPPGVPLLYSHDEITEEHTELLSDEKKRSYVFGLERDRIFVVK